jgi:hypothetical protein
MKFGKVLLAGGLLMITASAFSQCRETYAFCARGDKSWQFNSQSTSGVVAKGEDEELSIMVYQGVDYRLSLCSDNPDVEGKIQFEIYEMKTEKQYDPVKKRDIYVKTPVTILSNSEMEMAQEIDFTSDQTRRLYIRIVIPEEATSGGKKNLKVADYVCVGILVQHQRGVKTGFN